MKVQKFIGVKATYDYQDQLIFGNYENGEQQLIVDVRGWGAIQNLFSTTEEAMKFQDEVGQWITDAINEKLTKAWKV